MKYVLYKDINKPIYFVNEKFEFFYFQDKSKVSDYKQKWLLENFSNRCLPDYRCVDLKTGDITSIYVLYEKTITYDLSDPKIRDKIDSYRLMGYIEKTIADDFGVSTKSLQRRYPRKKSLPLSDNKKVPEIAV